MTVRVLLFGSAAAALGLTQAPVRLGPDRTCAGLKAALAAEHPALRPFLEPGRIAVNHAYAAPDRVLEEGDEVALIALVSGG